MLEAQDDDVFILNVQMASKMLRGASVAPEKKSHVLFNSGGVLPPDRMETVLRVTFPKMHEIEKRTGQAVPSRNTEACHGRNMGDSGETALMSTGATRCLAGKQRAKKKERKVGISGERRKAAEKQWWQIEVDCVNEVDSGSSAGHDRTQQEDVQQGLPGLEVVAVDLAGTSTGSKQAHMQTRGRPDGCVNLNTFVLNDVLGSTRVRPLCPSLIVFTPLDRCRVLQMRALFMPVVAPGSLAVRKRALRRLRQEGAVGVAIMISDTVTSSTQTWGEEWWCDGRPSFRNFSHMSFVFLS